MSFSEAIKLILTFLARADNLFNKYER